MGAAGAAAWRSGVLMHTVAELSRVAQRATQQSGRGDGRKVQLKPDDLPCGAACVRIEGEGAGEAMELVAVLDPLSKQAQRLTPLLMELHEALGLSVTVHLNPDLSVRETPRHPERTSALGGGPLIVCSLLAGPPLCHLLAYP
jgi:UDP-glucose:glycoprotein glucosyltransferase